MRKDVDSGANRGGVRRQHPRWRRIVLLLLMGGIIFSGTPLVIVGWPDLAFPHCFEQGRFVVRSDAPLDPGLSQALQDVEKRLRVLEIDRPDLQHRIYLCGSPRLYRFFARLMGLAPNSQGLNAPLVNTIFISLTFVDEMKERYGSRFRYSLVEGDLAHIVTHEIVHTFVEEELGRFAAKRLPRWKLEGYCEYAGVLDAVRRNELDSLESRYTRYESLERLGPGPTRLGYVRGQLLVEYLMTVEGWSFDRLMSDQTVEEEAHRQLVDFLAKWQFNPESCSLGRSGNARLYSFCASRSIDRKAWRSCSSERRSS